ncbi:MAG: hypothetical protein Q8N98_04290 [bacterium]|nr:hypothetical protein [bacterium]
MNKNIEKQKNILLAVLLGVLINIAGALFGGLIGFLLTGLIFVLLTKQSSGLTQGDAGWALGMMFGGVAMVAVVIGIPLGLLLANFIILPIIARKSRLFVPFGPHPVLKITLLTWGIIIAAIFLLKLLTG